MTPDDDVLTGLFAAYFNQDWQFETSDPDVVIADYVNDHYSRDQLGRLSRALSRLLADYADADKLAETLFRKYRCHFDPRLYGLDARKWIVSIIAQISVAVSALDKA